MFITYMIEESAGGRGHLGDHEVMEVSEVKEVSSLERRRGDSGTSIRCY